MPPGHRFKVKVFEAIHTQLIKSGLLATSQVRTPPTLPISLVEAVHCPDYIRSFVNGTLSPALVRRMGLPWSSLLVERTLSEVAGTLLTAELALEHGIACSTAGGTHHAHFAAPSGFCVLNDLAITTASLLSRGLVSRVLVCDLDVHQGDGTAALLANEPRAFTFSVQCEGNGFPIRTFSSSRDVELPPGVGDDEYLAMLSSTLPSIMDSFQPDIVLYDAGVDVHASDALGKMSLSDDGIRRRDLCVISTCVAAGVPVACVVGGGYDADVGALAARHCLVHAAAATVWQDAGLGRRGVL